MNRILERGKGELHNKKVLWELLLFAHASLKKERTSITKMESSSPWKPIVADKLWKAEGYPSCFDFQSMCVYGRYYEEYGRFFLGVVQQWLRMILRFFLFQKMQVIVME